MTNLEGWVAGWVHERLAQNRALFGNAQMLTSVVDNGSPVSEVDTTIPTEASVDAVGPAGGAGQTGAGSFSWAHVCGSSATLLIVSATYSNTSDSGVTMAATYAGAAMTSLGTTHPGTGGGTAGFVQTWFKLTPATGSNTVAITVTGGTGTPATVGGSVSFLNAGTPTSYTGATGSSTTAAVAVPTPAGNNAFVYNASAGGGAFSTNAQTLRVRDNASTIPGDAANLQIQTASGPNGSSISMSNGFGASQNWASTGVSIPPGNPLLTNTCTAFTPNAGSGYTVSVMMLNAQAAQPAAQPIWASGGVGNTGWVLLGDTAGGQFDVGCQIWYSSFPAGSSPGSSTISVTCNATVGGWSFAVRELLNCEKSGNPVGVIAAVNQANQTGAALTPKYGQGIIVGAQFSGNSQPTVTANAASTIVSSYAPASGHGSWSLIGNANTVAGTAQTIGITAATTALNSILVEIVPDGVRPYIQDFGSPCAYIVGTNATHTTTSASFLPVAGCQYFAAVSVDSDEGGTQPAVTSGTWNSGTGATPWVQVAKFDVSVFQPALELWMSTWPIGSSPVTTTVTFNGNTPGSQSVSFGIRAFTGVDPFDPVGAVLTGAVTVGSSAFTPQFTGSRAISCYGDRNEAPSPTALPSSTMIGSGSQTSTGEGFGAWVSSSCLIASVASTLGWSNVAALTDVNQEIWELIPANLHTVLYLTATTSANTGTNHFACSQTRGTSSTSAITNTTASGTDIQLSPTSGGANNMSWWFQVGACTVVNNISANIRGKEASTANNAGAGILIEHYASDGATLLSTILSDRTVPATITEYTTTDAAKILAAVAPTSTTFSNGDWIKITLKVRNVGTMGAGSPGVTNTYSGPTAGAAGDTWVRFLDALPAPTVTPPSTLYPQLMMV